MERPVVFNNRETWPPTPSHLPSLWSSFVILISMFRLPLIVALLFAAPSAATAQWAIQDSRTTADLRGIHSIGKGIAWASGTSGTVLRTTDDGAHWQPCVTPPGAGALDFRSIQGIDADTAIVMSSGKGDLSRLYKTTDACKTWKLVFTNPDKDGFLDAIRLGSTEGILVGDPIDGKFSIFHTNDEGLTSQPEHSRSPREAIHFGLLNSWLLVEITNTQITHHTMRCSCPPEMEHILRLLHTSM